MKDAIPFCRTGFVWLFLKGAERAYPGSTKCLELPSSLFVDEMRLMPISEVSRCFKLLQEQVQDELFFINSSQAMVLSDFTALYYPLRSAPDLFTAIMRLNALAKSFQSEVESITARSGGMLKWRYNIPREIGGDFQHDGIVAVFAYLQMLRMFHGETYQPLRIFLPGKPLGDPDQMRDIFGCDIEWNQQDAQVWIPHQDVVKINPHLPHTTLNKNIERLEVLRYIDLPQPHDFLRSIYEAINYTKEFEFPTLKSVAKIIGISSHQLQRKLQKHEINFTELVNHQLLCNQAPRLLATQNIDTVALTLGYKNGHSFTKAFKRVHGVTPRQYLDES